MAKKLKLNIPLLKKIKQHILEEPKRYDQDETVSFDKEGSLSWNGRTYPSCGTIACLGGWAYLLTHKNKPTAFTPIFSEAKRVCGLTDVQGSNLFDGSGGGWPQPYNAQYLKAKTVQGKANVAGKLLDKVIETNGKILESSSE